jgi:hypothetical protein
MESSVLIFIPLGGLEVGRMAEWSKKLTRLLGWGGGRGHQRFFGYHLPAGSSCDTASTLGTREPIFEFEFMDQTKTLDELLVASHY